MDNLKRRYTALRLIEISIKKELNRAGKTRQSNLEVVDWLYDVNNVKNQVKQIERSAGYKIRQSCCFDFFVYSRLFRDTSEEVDRLLYRSSAFVNNGLFITYDSVPELCPDSSQLLDTIWANLMDPNVVIMSVYGDWAVGKTAAMLKIRKQLATSHSFHSIFWVTFSQASGVYKLQTDIALQIDLHLPEVGRAAILLEALQKLDSFLIIIDDLREPISLIEVGIPQPNKENHSKIVLIARTINVCHVMGSDMNIRVGTCSPAEKWDLFICKVGNMVFTPSSKFVARQIVELCPDRPFIITAIGHAMRNEVDIQVWRTTLAHLRTRKFHHIDVMSLTILKVCYNLLKHEMVQKCFLYCALFPEDYHFNSEELIRYWISENLINDDTDMVAKINDGFKIIGKLQDVKMLEMSVKDEDDCLKVPGMWRNFAINVMKEEPEFSLVNSLCNSGHVRKVYEDVDQLRETRLFANEMFSRKFVKQYPRRSQLHGTILENLMDPNVGITSIYGARGVGKTTAMMNVSKQLASSDTFDSILWVTISKSMDLYQLQTEIALKMNLVLPETGRAARLLEGLKEIDNFLIIIDDIWRPFPISEVGIPEPSADNCCKIVLIFRDVEVCYLMKSDKLIKVGSLSLTEKWKMFVTKVGEMVLTPDIRPLARQLVELCPGLPAIINAIGHTMRYEVDIQVWVHTFVYLIGVEPETDEDMVFELSKLFYNRLKDEAVRKCFLYCALFPEDYRFKSEELIRYWIAESFIHGDADIVTKIDNGFKIMTKLLDANMLEMSGTSEDEWVKMSYLCRGCAIKIMEEEYDWSCARSGTSLKSLPVTWGRGQTRKCSLMGNQIEWLHTLEVYCGDVSTLLFQANPISYINPSFFGKMHSLEFLDLSYTWIVELPSSVSELAQLRVLFLHYCSTLENIPSLEKLKKLQVLNLCGTSIAELPQGMERLDSLISLDLSETTKLDHIQVGVISSLSRLEELRMQGSALCNTDPSVVTNYLMEIRSLKHLAILIISSVCYGDLLETIMCLQEHSLKVFSINIYGSTEDFDDV
ncbi:hypothetical protein ACHQM5_025289 [Ranunculus cassubicifolius]